MCACIDPWSPLVRHGILVYPGRDPFPPLSSFLTFRNTVGIATTIGLRFLRSPRQHRAVAFITWISASGVMLGVMALILTISVMNGFRENLVAAVSGTTPHVLVSPAEGVLEPEAVAQAEAALQASGAVVATAPYFSRQAFLQAGGQYRPVLLRGIDPTREAAVTNLPRYVQGDRLYLTGELAGLNLEEPTAQERLNALRTPPEGQNRLGILLGRPLALHLGLLVGDELTVISTEQRLTPLGPVPLLKRFRVVGLFETGLGSTDEVLAYIDLRVAQKLFRQGLTVQGIAVRTPRPEAINAAALRAALPGFKLRIWSEENRLIFQVMRLEKIGLFLILTLIIVVSFFNIIASLIMLVLEKRKAIAILKAIGATDGLIRRLFFMQGVWIGLVGTAAGLSLGLLGCWILQNFDVITLPPGVFPLATRLPVLVDWADVGLITAASFSICVLVTLYPASRAARLRPVENLRYD